MRLLKRGSKRWRQVDGGMQSGVHQLVFANLTPHLASIHDGGVLSRASGQDRSELVLSDPAARSWSFHLLQQTLFLISFLCSFLSVSPPPLPTPGFRLSMFSHSLGLCVPSRSAFFPFHFQHSAHTLIQSDTLNMCKSAGRSKLPAVTGKVS